MGEQTYREAVATVVFAAAWADGNVGEQEQVALTRILGRLGFSEPELGERVRRALSGPCDAPIEAPFDDESAAVEMMRYALAVMLADGWLSQEEVNFLVKTAAHLKIGSATLSALGREAEKLVAQIGQDRASAVERVEALLPERRPELAPSGPGDLASDAASREALARLVDPDGDLSGAELPG